MAGKGGGGGWEREWKARGFEIVCVYVCGWVWVWVFDHVQTSVSLLNSHLADR